MAVSNYSLVYPNAPTPFVATVAPVSLNSQLDDLLYSPELHQRDSSPARENEPYSQPQRRSKLRKRAGPPYLPPPNHFTHYPREPAPPAPQYSMHTQLYNNPRLSVHVETQRVHELSGTHHTNQGEYVHDPSGDYETELANRRDRLPPSRAPPQPAPDYTRTSYRHFQNPYNPTESPIQHIQPGFGFQGQPNHNFGGHAPRPQPSQPPQQHTAPQPKPAPQPVAVNPQAGTDRVGAGGRPPGFTKVDSSGGSNTKTQLHAVLDYDDDEDYYDDVPGNGGANVLTQRVTPLQGPILLKNGTVPVVPLFSYPTVNNGSYYQIPILWTALSLALGYELQGQVIKGVPCVKRNYQLYCPTAGNAYPLHKIESFIDENKALMKRMYGAFGSGAPSPGGQRRRRAPGVPDPDPHPHNGDSYFRRHVRQANTPPPPPLTNNEGNATNRVDACESKTEVVTPYWALNSARKLRAIVNTMHFEQAIHQEVCRDKKLVFGKMFDSIQRPGATEVGEKDNMATSKTTTARCAGDCGCEQKYKWHRLLAYDPDEDCSGIFMDWFLFPSCCVCRCNP